MRVRVRLSMKEKTQLLSNSRKFHIDYEDVELWMRHTYEHPLTLEEHISMSFVDLNRF